MVCKSVESSRRTEGGRLFEAVLAEISSRFVNLPSDQIDDEIEIAQAKLCRCLGVDLSSLWQRVAGAPDEFELTHVYRQLSGPPIPARMKAAEHFPWVLKQLASERLFRCRDTEKTPPEATADRATWRRFGIRSALAIPLSAGGGQDFGILSFDSIRGAREWPDDLVKRVQIVAQVFASALERKRTDAALREREERLQLAASAAGVGMWSFDVRTDAFWTNDRGRMLFNLEPDAEISMQRFLDLIHPEDRHPVVVAISKAVDDDQEIDVEYRIFSPDGSERWIHSRGRRESTIASGRLFGVSMEVTARKHSEAAQAAQLEFETLLADLSRNVISADADGIDPEIGRAQSLACVHFDIELSLIWQWSRDNPGSQTLTHVYQAGGRLQLPEKMDARQHFPWSLEQMMAGRTVALESIDEAPPEAESTKRSWRRFGAKSVLIIPLATGGEPAIGSISFVALTEKRQWPDDTVKRLGLVAEVVANALKRKHSEDRLRSSLGEIKALKSQLEVENAYLRAEHLRCHGSGHMVGKSPAMLRVFDLVEQVAPTGATVLIEGETGTGKELIARRVHELSPRSGRAMVKVNCAALPSTLVESELFGREKGAYTGAASREPGRFEIADGSTIFLDEIAELPLELQAKLLRVLEEGQFERLGSSRTITTDVRVIAATNRDLRVEVETGRFRRDLYFRLAVFPIEVPPLRERPGDVPLLLWAIVQELSTGMNKTVESVPRKDLERLERYHWPGNVRELRNVVERSLILSRGPELRVEPPVGQRTETDTVLSLDDAQRRHIARALEAAGGRIAGPGGAAEVLAVKPTTLRSKMQRLGLDPKDQRDDYSSS